MKLKFDLDNLWNGMAWGAVLALSLGSLIWGIVKILTA